jgi:endonuclease YncB( thermonuclease family)
MHKKIALLMLLLLAAAAGIFAQKSDSSKPLMVQAHILSIDDSDRITFATKDGTVYAASILAADAPDKDQDLYKKAKKRFSELIDGKDVTAIIHTVENGKFAAAIFVGGKDVSLQMLQDGLAWYYPVHSRQLTSGEREKYTQAEASARVAKVGLWDAKDPIAPWVFRGEKIEPAAKVETIKAEDAPRYLTSDETSPVPGRSYVLGPRGGCYYLNDTGYKVYVKNKSLCGVKPQ